MARWSEYETVTPHLEVDVELSNVESSGDMLNELPLSVYTTIRDRSYKLSSLADYSDDGFPTSSPLVVPAKSKAENESAFTSTLIPNAGVFSNQISKGTKGGDGKYPIVNDLTLAIDFVEPVTGTVMVYFGITGVNGRYKTHSQSSNWIPFQATNGILEFDAEGITELDIQAISTDRPFERVNLSEIDIRIYGESLEMDHLVGEIRTIQEVDIFNETIPLNELDFTLDNTDGTYDADYPLVGGKRPIDDLAVGSTIHYYVTLGYDNGSTKDIDFGHFVVQNVESSEDDVRVTCFDARYKMGEAIDLTDFLTGKGDTFVITELIDYIFNQFGVEYELDMKGVASRLGNTQYVRDNMYEPAIELLRSCIQADSLRCWWDGEKTILNHIESIEETPDTEIYEITLDEQFKYPTKYDMDVYNGIIITVGNEQRIIDIRQRDKEQRKFLSLDLSILSEVDEDLLVWWSNWLKQRYSMSARFYPELALGDIIRAGGRWSADTPSNYIVRRLESTFDGSISMDVRMDKEE